jgi:hypothetical protein
VVACTYGLHAIEKHGEEAALVRSCIEQQGPTETWVNPETGRSAWLCWTPEGWGVQIRIGEQEITSFVKNKLHDIDQVRRYLLNRNYIKGITP